MFAIIFRACCSSSSKKKSELVCEKHWTYFWQRFIGSGFLHDQCISAVAQSRFIFMILAPPYHTHRHKANHQYEQRRWNRPWDESVIRKCKRLLFACDKLFMQFFSLALDAAALSKCVCFCYWCSQCSFHQNNNKKPSPRDYRIFDRKWNGTKASRFSRCKNEWMKWKSEKEKTRQRHFRDRSSGKNGMIK